eukprot:CAMPEP_0179077178 /NCGR_PEP_ID=MMETSP0796-20121207/34481_1 /TAXON_ID=73915 /ORGANISM="Pyrodinium bahamense, Strain pbaha01" /LENGTH=71 /DNA_ID=CAMNT_0020774451 /DNA_START=72 /DNA_END=287 /DNA_ORIENTATION=+
MAHQPAGMDDFDEVLNNLLETVERVKLENDARVLGQSRARRPGPLENTEAGDNEPEPEPQHPVAGQHSESA